MDKASPVEKGKRIQLIIYYRNNRTLDLLMKNNSKPNEDPSKQHVVMYRFLCPVQAYVGITTVRLSKRILDHVQGGSA